MDATGQGSDHAPHARRYLVLLGAFFGCSLSAVPLLMGPLYAPLQAEFGWGRAVVSSAILISTAVTTLLYPLIGSLLDRFGPRRLTLIGSPLYAAGLAGVGLAGGPAWTWWLGWAGFALAGAIITPLTWTAAVAKVFHAKSRGTALAVALAGSSAIGIVIPGLALWIAGQFPWRMVFFLFALYPLLVIWPLSWLTIPAEPSGGRQAGMGAGDSGSYRDIVRNPTFPTLALAVFAHACVSGVLMLHFVPMLALFSFTPATVALVAGAFGPAALAGRLGVGALLASRLPTALVYAGSVLLGIPAIWLLVLAPPSMGTAVAGVVATGLCQGSALVYVSFMTSRIYPLSEFGRAAALLTGAYAAAFGIGPVVAGALFDRAHSYAPVALFVFAVAAGGAIAAVMTGRRVDAAPLNH